MSLEALVLLAVFVVLPLIQRLLGESRQRNRRPRGRVDTPPRQAPPTSAPRLAEGAVPPLPDTAPLSASDATTGRASNWASATA